MYRSAKSPPRESAGKCPPASAKRVRAPELSATSSVAGELRAGEAMAAESKLELSSIRAALIRQEDTIIFALIERAQFAHNSVCYEPDAPAYQELVSVWL